MINKKYFILFVILIIIFLGYFLFKNNPKYKNIKVIKKENKKEIIFSENKKITITNGLKHIVKLEEVLSGGPKKDGIPPIDNPKFIKASEVNFLNNNDEGIAFVDEKNIPYFLPFRILVWHEIVNMKINNKGRPDFPISATYCPLCKTGIVYEAIVDNKDTSFGTSGKLWQSNLLMYDRQEKENEESLWSQVLGKSVVGKSSGDKLTIYKSSIADYDSWKKEHINTKVLSTETGSKRNYSQDPYGPSYYKGDSIYFPVNFSDTKNHPKEVILGIEIDGSFLAYKKESLEKVDDIFGSNFIKIRRKKDGSIELMVNEKEYSYIEGFWFSWKSVHPSSILR